MEKWKEEMDHLSRFTLDSTELLVYFVDSLLTFASFLVASLKRPFQGKIDETTCGAGYESSSSIGFFCVIALISCCTVFSLLQHRRISFCRSMVC